MNVSFAAPCKVALTSTPATKTCRRGPRKGKSHLAVYVPGSICTGSAPGNFLIANHAPRGRKEWRRCSLSALGCWQHLRQPVRGFCHPFAIAERVAGCTLSFFAMQLKNPPYWGIMIT
jgi:hypothetical protein